MAWNPQLLFGHLARKVAPLSNFISFYHRASLEVEEAYGLIGLHPSSEVELRPTATLGLIIRKTRWQPSTEDR